jgi:hypothetical protein
MLSFTISYPDLIKLPYFAGSHSLKEGIGGEKRPKEDKVATYIFTAPTRTTTIITWNLVH